MIKAAICIDKSGGIMFNNRRVSQDSKVRERLLELIGEQKLFISPYSSKQFDADTRIHISDNFLDQASEDDICFIEDTDININEIGELYLFHWNRDYPADRVFTFNPKESGFKRIRKEDFKGTSHNKISLEVYRRIDI